VVKRAAAAGRLRFSTDYAAAVSHASVVMIAVGTPSNEDGAADLSHVLACATTLGQLIASDTIVVVKSTVPVGTCDQVRQALAARLSQRGLTPMVSVASNPEFLKEGCAVADFVRPDRIIIGTNEPHVEEALRQLYKPFNRNRDRLIVMEVRAAEFTKYAANAMLALRISFMNELADLADRIGVDIEQVRTGIGADSRIGPHFLYPGVGFGGSCFPKDLRALVRTAHAEGSAGDMVGAALRVNHRQPIAFAERIARFFRGDLRGRTVAVWGLAFKANTDDMREAPSLAVIQRLVELGARIRAYDPAAAQNARVVLGGLKDVMLCATAREAVQGADVLAVVTEWSEFRSPDFRWLAATLGERAVFDGRNLYDPSLVRSVGLHYEGVGRS
jgi:UDPglucose 6-dehydrogenase